jgi:hypothetical protein
MRTLRLVVLIFCLLELAAALHATIFGTVRGVVHDSQHLPIPAASVTLKAQDSQWTEVQKTNDNGEFEFGAVPIGNYTVTVTAEGFQQQQQMLLVNSDTTPVLHFELALASVTTKTVVTGEAISAPTDRVTPTTTVSRQDIQFTPGADRTDSMAIITDNVPGAYMVHDMLHIRGGHQFSWLIDGVPVPNTSIASNVGPQIDPKDLDYVEVQRGSYDAEYGDRTYGVFNAVPRTGFERDHECELVLSYGNYEQTNDEINCGGHTQRFAYYASLNGNQTNLGLETPTSQITHDEANGLGGFSSFIFNATPHDQLRVVASLRRDDFQVPNPPTVEISQPFPYSPEMLTVTPVAGAFQDDTQRERDGMVILSWIHTFAGPHNGLLTISPFYHRNDANYDSSPGDFPNAVTNHRSSGYAGGQATVSATIAKNNLEGGIYTYWQHDNQLFGVLFNDGFGPPIQDTEIVNGNLEAIWIGDKFQPTSWLTLNGGVRQTHFGSKAVTENPTSPRAGVAIRAPRLNWVFRAFYGQFYQAPPLATISGPLLGLVNIPSDLVSPQQFIPLVGERDTEDQFGVEIPYKGWAMDVDTFHTKSLNFLDHGNVNYDFNGTPVSTNIFFPLATQYARVSAWELTLRSPLLWRRLQTHLAYSNQLAQFMGTITGGLSNFAVQEGWAPLDHDQRNTLNVGFAMRLPWTSSLNGNVNYGSGFTNGAARSFPGLVPPAPDYLSGHTTLDLSVSKSLGERFSVAINALNVTNSHLLIDDSLTFGGFHFNDPREVYAELRYRFHY